MLTKHWSQTEPERLNSWSDPGFSVNRSGIPNIAKMSTKLVCLKDFEDHAHKTLSHNAWTYFKNPAEDAITLKDNEQAFKRYRLLPRVLRDVSNRDLSTHILGHKVSFPVGISPTAMQKMAHPDGELASARAAGALDTVFTLSTYANSTIQEVADYAPNTLKFFQLYIAAGEVGRQITKDLVRKAERHGYKALVLTVDSSKLGVRYHSLKSQFRLPSHLSVANLADALPGVDLHAHQNFEFDPTLTWDNLKWLVSFTTLPVIVKGIHSAADAVLAVECGVAAVWVSNHGGRQLDGVPATIDMLSSVVRAVAGRCEVYLDGGVRSGTDILKALALGARAVFIGTPAIYGLVYDGQNGVEQVLGILRNELDTAMALTGCARIADIKPELVIHESQLYSKL